MTDRTFSLQVRGIAGVGWDHITVVKAKTFDKALQRAENIISWHKRPPTIPTRPEEAGYYSPHEWRLQPFEPVDF